MGQRTAPAIRDLNNLTSGERMYRASANSLWLNMLTPYYLDIVQPNLEPGSWFLQKPFARGTEKPPFLPQPYRGRHWDIVRMLHHDYWIGSFGRADGMTEWIDLDFDAHDGSGASAEAAYREVRRLLGPEFVPLVYRTPRGGLRAWYRVTCAPMDGLTSNSDGLVSRALRVAGLEPQPGFIEVFPRPLAVNRLPLGRRMPILDPDTLQPVRGAVIGDRFRVAPLRGAISALENWYARGDTGLIERLRRLDVPRSRPIAVPEAPTSLIKESEMPRGQPDPERLAAYLTGLPGPGTRNRMQFEVGKAMILYPTVFSAYGMVEGANDATVARAIARYLAVMHNGYSKEWRRAARKGDEAAIQFFSTSYLKRNAHGRHMIDRIRRSLARPATGAGLTAQVAIADRHRILALSTAAFNDAGADRWRFEVWMTALIRSAKTVHRYALRNAIRQAGVEGEGLRSEAADADPVSSVPAPAGHIVVQLAAKWMERWPYGSGAAGGKTNYRRYLDIALKDGWLRVHEEHVWVPRLYPSAPRDLPGVATRYAIRKPAPARSGDLAARIKMVRAFCGTVMNAGRPLSTDEMYHLLDLSRLGVDLPRRYGKATARRLAGYLAIFESWVGAQESTPEP